MGKFALGRRGSPRSKTSALTEQILGYLAVKNVPAWRNNTMAVWDAKRNTYRSVKPRDKGVADIIAVVPPAGRLLEIEIKVGGDRQSEWQKMHQKWIESAGAAYLIVKDFDDAINQIDKTIR